MAVHSESERQVVVTGLGIVSPIGVGIEDFWNGLRSGVSGVRLLEQPLAYLPVPMRIAAEVRDFNASDYTKTREQKKAIRVMCRDIQLGFASATLALDHSGIVEGTVEPERLGVDFGANLMFSPPDELGEANFSCIGEADHKFHGERWGDLGLSKMFPLWLLKFLPNMPACHIGIAADARGPNNSITLDEASSNLVVGEAFRVIARGHADVMIAGSTGNRVHPLKGIHAAMWDELATEGATPAEACRPFDLHRTGQVIGEGAATIIMEDAEHAKRRGARVYATVLGAGSSCVVRLGKQADHRRALAQAMNAALSDAKLEPRDVGHINAHGLSTRYMDRQEALAIHDVFGDFAEKVPVTALKSYVGAAAAGAGSMELVGSLCALQHGVIPQTLNYKHPDPECQLNVVANQPLKTENKVVLKVNITSVGQASAVVMRGE